MRAALAALVGTVALIAGGVAQAQEGTLVLSGPFVSEIATDDGRVVLATATRDGGPARLYTIEGDTLTPLPIKRSAHGFDVDLGGDKAVYARCGARCDLYRYDFASGREAKLTRLSRKNCSETQPEIDGETVTFFRDGDRACAPGVYVARGNAKPRRVFRSNDVYEVEVAGGRIAIAGYRFERQYTFGVWLLQLDGKGSVRALTRGCCNPDHTPPGPVHAHLTLDGDFAYWARLEDNEFTTDGSIWRAPLAAGRCVADFFEDEEIAALAVVGGEVWYAIGSEVRVLPATALSDAGPC